MDIDEAARELDLLATIGPRLSGSDAQNQLVEHVKNRWTSLGLKVHEDVARFERWDVRGQRLRLGDREVEISSVFPYSGTTGSGGVQSTLHLLRGPMPRWSRARGGIAVIELHNRDVPFHAAVASWNPDDPWEPTSNPLVPATLAGLGLPRARRSGVRAVVFAWRGISAANARGQYVPFTLPYQDIPAVFVAGAAADDMVEAARRGERADLELKAFITPDSSMTTLWTVVEGGERPEETMLVVSHSDGTNVVEENGHLGLIALAEEVSKQRPKRSVVFVLTAGHLRIPAVTDHGQATSRWLREHPEWWAGDAGQRRAVAGLVIEHLGARQYADIGDDDVPTGLAEPELLYASTRELQALAAAEWRGSEPGPTRISKPNALIQFGEGQPLLQSRIPNIALVTTPQYLLSCEQGDYVDVALLLRQINSFSRLLRRMDALPSNGFGAVPANTVVRKIPTAVKLLLSVATSSIRLPRRERRG